MRIRGKRILGLLVLSSLVIGAGGCGSSGGSSDGKKSSSGKSKWDGETLTVLGYGGSVQEAMEEAWFKPFEEKYGVKVESVSPPDSGQLTAMGEAGSCDYDVLINDPNNFLKWADSGYMEKLDYNVIDKTDFGDGYYDDYWCAADLYTTSICWNTDKFKGKTAPDTWADVWEDTKDGDTTMYNYPMLTLETALLADGVKADEIYPLDTDRAFKKLDEIKDKVRVWYDSGEQPVQALSKGEVSTGGVWVGRALAAKDNGDPIDVSFNESVVGIDAFGVMKGAPDKELAMEFIAFCTTAEAGARFMEAYPYGVVNDKAYDKVSAKASDKLCVKPEYKDSQVVVDYDYWHKNTDKLVEEWNKWIMKK